MTVFPKELLHAQIPTNKGKLLKIYLLKNIHSNNKNNTLVWTSGPRRISGTLHRWAAKSRHGVWGVTWVPSFQLSTGFVALFLYLTIMLTLANLASASIALASDKHLLSIRLFFASLLQFTHSLCVPSVAAFYSSSRLLLIALFPCILASAPLPPASHSAGLQFRFPESKCGARIKRTGGGLRFELHEGKPHPLRLKAKKVR